ncbi:MAG: hypothetical protein K2I72_01200, partial [Bacilli bacterium]|nr:hypothetical protein [Bacilli bacterium]
DIRLVAGTWDDQTSLLSRFIVAGGGGGGGMDGGDYQYEPGGAGGGLEGYKYGDRTGAGGTQTSGWAFGHGFAATSSNLEFTTTKYGGSGAGGGWYGGMNPPSPNGQTAGGGGSGFVWTKTSKDVVPESYLIDEKYYLKMAKTIAGNLEVPTYDGTGTMTGNNDNGYAKISYYNPAYLDNLTSLTVDKGTLTPTFSERTEEYDLSLNVDDIEITIAATTRLREALVTGTGTFMVPAGNTTFPVMMTNIDGTISIYNINASRPSSPSALLKGFKVNGTLYEGFVENKTTYDIELEADVDIINLELIKKYPSQRISEETIYNFEGTELTKQVIVFSEADLSNEVYTFNFTRKKSSLLRSLVFSNAQLTDSFRPRHLNYTVDMSEYERVLEIDAKAYFDEAVITITENRYVGPDDKVVTIQVDLDGVPSTIYTLNINRIEGNKADVLEDYSYTGSYQTFVAPFTGNYTLEVWGARGGGKHFSSYLGPGGPGGYSKGNIRLEEGDILYIYVGGQGSWCRSASCLAAGGWNGGGSGYKVKSTTRDPVTSGGGATDIRLVAGAWDNPTSLLSRFIVAGGGGGGGMDGDYMYEPGGAGGGLEGYKYGDRTGAGGTQTSGWAFGQGFAANPDNFGFISSEFGGSGAGGGWYGGMHPPAANNHTAGGGGSGFVLTAASRKNTPEGYSVSDKYYLKDAETIAGNQSMPNYTGTGTMTGNNGNGYAKITAQSEVKGDTFLDSITLNDGNISIDFAPWTLEYNIDLTKDVMNIKIDAIAKDPEAKILGLGVYGLAPGLNVKRIVVSTSDGSSKVYTLNINREASDDPTPQNILLKNQYSYLCYLDEYYCKYTFEPATTLYEINLPFVT